MSELTNRIIACSGLARCDDTRSGSRLRPYEGSLYTFINAGLHAKHPNELSTYHRFSSDPSLLVYLTTAGANGLEKRLL